MNKLASTLLAAFVLLAADVALAKNYAEKGVVEIGGTGSFATDRQTREFQGEEAKTTTNAFAFNPTIGFFVAPNLELIGRLGVNVTSVDTEGLGTSETVVNLLAGVAYYVPAGTFYAGPRGGIGYARATGSEGTFNLEVTGSGIVILGGGGIKIPIGTAGLIDVGGSIQYSSLNVDVEGGFPPMSASSNGLGFNLEAGFFLYF